MAAQLRVRLWDPACNADYAHLPRKLLNPPTWCVFNKRFHHLSAAITASDTLVNRGAWAEWFRQSFVTTLYTNMEEYTTRCGPSTLHARKSCSDYDPADPEPFISVLCASCQKTAYHDSLGSISYDPQLRMRSKLERRNRCNPHVCSALELSIKEATPNYTTRLAIHTLRCLHPLVSPRVTYRACGLGPLIVHSWSSMPFSPTVAMTPRCSLPMSHSADRATLSRPCRTLPAREHTTVCAAIHWQCSPRKAMARGMGVIGLMSVCAD